MSRWGHGHSILVGVLIAGLAMQHLLWLLTAAFVIGVVVGRVWGTLGRVLGSLGRRVPWHQAGLTRKVW